MATRDPQAATLRAIRAAVGGAWIQSAALSDLGLGPLESQDRAVEASDEAGNQLLAVADGEDESSASRHCLKALLDVFAWSDDSPESRLRRGFVLASEKLRDRPERGRCSLVAIVITRDLKAWIAAAGDCRAYRLRAARLELLADLPDAASEPPQHPPDSEARSDIVLHAVDVRPGDRFLLCSRGLSRLTDEEIAQALQFPTPRVMTSQLIKRLRALGQPLRVTVQIAAVSEPLGKRNQAAVPAPAWRHALIAASLAGAALLLTAGGVLTRQLLSPTSTPGTAVEQLPAAEERSAPARASALATPVATVAPEEQPAPAVDEKSSPPLGPWIGYADPETGEERVEIVAPQRFARDAASGRSPSPFELAKRDAARPAVAATRSTAPAPDPVASESISPTAEPVAPAVEPTTRPPEPVATSPESITPSIEPVAGPVQPAARPAKPVASSPEPPATAIEPVQPAVEPAPTADELIAAPVEPAQAPAGPVESPAEPVTPSVGAAATAIEPVALPVEPAEPVPPTVEPAPTEAVAPPAGPVAPTVQAVSAAASPVALPVEPSADPVERPEPPAAGEPGLQAQTEVPESLEQARAHTTGEVPAEPTLVAEISPGTGRDDSLERAVQDFLSSWSQAVERADHALYKQLGFEQSRGRFNRRYRGHKNQRLRLDPLEMRRASSDEIQLRVLAVYTYRDRQGSHLLQKERRVVLREGADGLRYAGTW
jgi:serine/threonine protein phosphatase PrpC